MSPTPPTSNPKAGPSSHGETPRLKGADTCMTWGYLKAHRAPQVSLGGL